MTLKDFGEWLLGKNTGVVPHCLLYDFEFRVAFFLDYLTAKDRETSLPYCLTRGWGQKWPINAYTKGIWKVNATDEAEFELGL